MTHRIQCGLLGAMLALAVIVACEAKSPGLPVAFDPTPPAPQAPLSPLPAPTPLPLALTEPLAPRMPLPAESPAAVHDAQGPTGVQGSLSDRPGWGPCTTGMSVPQLFDNIALVFDCRLLLELQGQLDSEGVLNWGDDTNIEQWEGVTVSGTPLRVTELNLPDRNLRGSLPPGMGNLTALKVLILRDNQLSGQIPRELSNLSKLEILNLSFNHLSGEVPWELGNLEYLWVAHLGSNFDSLNHDYLCAAYKLPKWWSEAGYNLSILSRTSSSRNSSPAPPSVERCEPPGPPAPWEDLIHECATQGAVTQPDVDVGLAEDCAALLSSQPALEGSAALNWSAGRPLQLWDGVVVDSESRRVAGLHLSDRGLDGIVPPDLFKLAHLAELDLSSNQLGWEIPSAFGDLSRLVKMDLSSNDFVWGIPKRAWPSTESAGIGPWRQ